MNMRHARRILAACLFLGATSSQAAFYFTDGFNGPAFNPNLVDIDHMYFFSAGKTGTTSARSYLRSLDSGYAGIDFQADLIYSMGGTSSGAAGVFFGIGAATKDAGFFDEPEAALYLIDHANGFPVWPASNIVVRVNRPGSGNTSDLANTPFPDGVSYARITKLGDTLTFQYDFAYNGSTFIPDGAYTTSLSAAAPFLASGPSYLLFGTGSSPSRFDSIAVTPLLAIPEADIYATLVAGLGLLGFAARRRKRGTVPIFRSAARRSRS